MATPLAPHGPVESMEPITPDPPAWSHRAVLHQRWSQLAYFHWRYDPDVVQRLLPDGVRVDTFDGSAWVGLIPFEMRDVRIGPSPAVPWLGSFIETNVRTYVVDASGRRAVWFFSLDVPRSAIVGVARSVFSLPYRWAAAEHVVEHDWHRYRTIRRWHRGSSPYADMSFCVGDRIADDDVGDLEHFLSARWGLVTSRRHRLLFGRVDHPRWPLHHVERVSIEQNLIQAAGLPTPSGAPHARYSPGVDVRVAWFEKSHARTVPALALPSEVVR
jgi:uncharacterized protein YqjF (DUF2071 family)